MSFRPMSESSELDDDTDEVQPTKALILTEPDGFIELTESTLVTYATGVGRFILRGVIILLVFAALMGGFLAMERQPAISQTFGLTDLRLRTQALPDAIFWSYRKWANTKAESYSPIDTRFGYARDFVGGQLLVHEYSSKGRVEKRYPLASIEIYDHQHAAIRQWIRERRGAETRFDIYINKKGLEHVVVWTGSGPWNVQLIAQGFAYPSPNPPTNVVDAAFAEHYWNRVRGSH